MINSLSKIALVVGLLVLLPTDAVNAQVQMTRMPTRLEEALVDSNLGAILRGNVRAQRASVAAPRVASLPVSAPTAPTYSNEPSRFGAIKPAVDNSRAVATKLPTIEQTEMPPSPVRKPAELSYSDEAPPEPTPAIRSGASAPKAITAADKIPPQSNLNKNTNPLEPLAPIQGQLRFRVTGVSAIIENQPSDMLIEVYNPTSYPIGPVEVNVKVPAELTVTRFDKDAWLDAERRIIAFQLERVEPGAIEKISMKGVSQSAGQTVLDVALLSGDTMVAQRSVKTQVFPQQLARKHNFGDTTDRDTIRK